MVFTVTSLSRVVEQFFGPNSNQLRLSCRLRQAKGARRAGTNIRQLSIVASCAVSAQAVGGDHVGLALSVASN